jgi:hypothetical protein
MVSCSPRLDPPPGPPPEPLTSHAAAAAEIAALRQSQRAMAETLRRALPFLPGHSPVQRDVRACLDRAERLA